MKQKQRLLTVLMTLLLSVTGAWALDGAGTNSDPYQLGSLQDWKDFAAIVNNGTNPAANAKMTADIDLGTDATMVGNANTNPYQGVFNGQGHKLTVNWTVNGGGDGVAPFRYINGATIQKLHVDGSISATGSIQRAAASHAAYSIGNATSTISECWSSASITGYDTMGGIFGVAYGTSTVNIIDCLFTGSIHPTNQDEGCCAGFASQAMKDESNVPTINITRGLYLGSYTGSTDRCYNFVRNDFPDRFGVHTVTDCYFKNVYGTAQGTQASDANLANGTTTSALNNGRTGDDAVWVQQGSQPILKTFAVKTDASGAYLIGSVQNWKDFAAIVETTPTANAKMTADINLGTDQTVIGGVYNGSTLFYQGTFDGQGHTLTIAYDVKSGDGERFTTPFSLIEGATIKNLHLDGTVNSTYAYGGSIASILNGTNTIENVWNSVTAVCTMGGWVQMGGFIGVLGSGATATISDCLYTGSITHNGGYSGYFNGGYGPKPTVNNCLVLGTFTGEFGFNGNYNNCYCKHASTTGVTQPSDENLSDGTTTAALNDERTGEAAPWVQDPVSKQPRLKQFVLQQDGSGNYLIGSVQDWKDFATLVKTNPAINAKMTADINLGTDKTMAGTSSSNYQGVFDGQGHTITINFEVTENYLGLFRYISGATIKNLHVTGTISTNYYGYAGGIVGVASGTSTIQNCQSSVNIQSTIVGDGVLGGIVACSAPENSGATLNINDCLFNGSMVGSSTMTCGGFVAWRYDGNTVNISNSIFLPTSATVSTTYSACFVGHDATSLTNCYHKTVIGTVQGVEATAENLADGTTTTALNNGRKNGPWVQDAVSGEPRLDLFMATTSLTANEGKTGEYWSTYYDGAKSSIADANTTVYTGKVSGDKIALTEVTDKTIPAGNAVILKSTAANVTLTKTSATGTLADNDLKGVDVATAKTNVYCLNKNGTVVGFYKYIGDVPAHRAYIESISSARMFSLGDGDATGIVSMEEGRGIKVNGTDEWYSLDGRQLNAQPTRKGVYVKDGKKVVIK